MLRRLALLCLMSLLCTIAWGQTKRAPTLVDLIEVPQLRDPQLSPDGSQLLYTLAEADWKANKRITHIWRADTDGGEAVQLTNGEKGEQSPPLVARRPLHRVHRRSR